MISGLKTKAIIIFASFFIVCGVAQAHGPSHLYAQIQYLKEEVRALGAQLQEKLQPKPMVAGAGVVNNICYTFTKALQKGSKGTDVYYLQAALKLQGFSVNSSEQNSFTFGNTTKTGVVKFQEKYRSEILTPNGLTYGTGVVTTSTIIKLNSLYSCAPAPASTSTSGRFLTSATIPPSVPYPMNVLVIKYFPLTADGQNIDVNVTGDVSERYDIVRQKTVDLTTALAERIENASRYLGYLNPSAQNSLDYSVLETFEHTTPYPVKTLPGETRPRVDYNAILNAHNICSYVEQQGVNEVWVWAYSGPYPHFLGWESNMAGPNGDISNSDRWTDDMPICAKTYRTYLFNYQRGTAEAIESWGHQMEAELDALAVDFPWRTLWQGPPYPQVTGVTGRCGSVHNAPNARFEYDRGNTIPQASDCLNWNPDSIGTLSDISCTNWGCNGTTDQDNPALNYQVWNWQNLPGLNNQETYQGNQIRNLWEVHGKFDEVIGPKTFFVPSSVYEMKITAPTLGSVFPWNSQVTLAWNRYYLGHEVAFPVSVSLFTPGTSPEILPLASGLTTINAGCNSLYETTCSYLWRGENWGADFQFVITDAMGRSFYSQKFNVNAPPSSSIYYTSSLDIKATIGAKSYFDFYTQGISSSAVPVFELVTSGGTKYTVPAKKISIELANLFGWTHHWIYEWDPSGSVLDSGGTAQVIPSGEYTINTILGGAIAPKHAILSDPVFRIVYPNSGTYGIGRSVTISLTNNIPTTNYSGIALELHKKTAGGMEYHSHVARGLVGANTSYIWYVPNTLPLGEYYIRAAFENFVGNSQLPKEDVSDSAIVITKLYPAVTSPSAGTKLVKGVTTTIVWEDQNPTALKYAISLKRTNSFLQTITNVSSSLRSFTWRVPDTLTPSSTYRIAIGLSHTDLFSIVDSYDVDGNKKYEPLTDALLILRYLYGFTDANLITGAIGSGATRTTASAIIAYLNGLKNWGALDVDGNGKAEPLTDAVLIQRYLFGFTGNTLISGAVATDATRKTAPEIEAYIRPYVGK